MGGRERSVRLREEHAASARLAGLDALARLGRGAVAGDGQAADRDLELVLDGLLGLGRAVPVREDELGGVAGEDVGEVLPGVDRDGVRLQALAGALEERLLEAVEQLADAHAEAVEGDLDLLRLALLVELAQAELAERAPLAHV